MDWQYYQGIWTPTTKCFYKLGIDFEEIIELQQSGLKNLIEDDLNFISVLMKSGLYIDGERFKIRFAKPKSGKLKTIRKGQFTAIIQDKKKRPSLCFIDNDGDVGRFVYKKGKLVDPDSPLEFKRLQHPSEQ